MERFRPGWGWLLNCLGPHEATGCLPAVGCGRAAGRTARARLRPRRRRPGATPMPLSSGQALPAAAAAAIRCTSLAIWVCVSTGKRRGRQQIDLSCGLWPGTAPAGTGPRGRSRFSGDGGGEAETARPSSAEGPRGRLDGIRAAVPAWGATAAAAGAGGGGDNTARGNPADRLSMPGAGRHIVDHSPTRWPWSHRIVMRCAPRASNGPNHLGLCALQVHGGSRHTPSSMETSKFSPSHGGRGTASSWAAAAAAAVGAAREHTMLRPHLTITRRGRTPPRRTPAAMSAAVRSRCRRTMPRHWRPRRRGPYR